MSIFLFKVGIPKVLINYKSFLYGKKEESKKKPEANFSRFMFDVVRYKGKKYFKFHGSAVTVDVEASRIGIVV